MKLFLAEVEGEHYEFHINAENEQDARSTAVEHFELIGMEEWIEKLVITEMK